MALNTKKWDDRLTEIYAAIRSCDDQFQSESIVTTQLKAELDSMGEARRKEISNGLHLQSQNTPDWRKWVRCIGLLEAVLVSPRARRTFTAIKNQYNQTPAIDVRRAMRSLIKVLDPWQDYGKPDMAVLRPLKMGASISGGAADGPGSIACFVRDRVSGDAMALSNQHVVLQQFGAATDPASVVPVYQPAKMNGGGRDRIGEYVRGFLDARMDAAVVRLDPTITYANETRDGPNTPGVRIVGINRTLPNVGDEVWKCGAMSGVSRGRIKDPNKPSSSVPHAKFGGLVTFQNQIEVESLIDGREFQIPGDSGSALLNMNNEIIGLLHGGGNGGAIATPIGAVLDRLGVDFI